MFRGPTPFIHFAKDEGHLQAAKIVDRLSKEGAVVYFTPKDRKNKVVKDLLSTERLEAAREQYKLACEAAEAAVINQLRNLAGTLEVCLCHVLHLHLQRPLCS